MCEWQGVWPEMIYLHIFGRSGCTPTHLKFINLHYHETFNFIRGHPEHDFGQPQIIIIHP